MGHIVITLQVHTNPIRSSNATSRMFKGGIRWAFWKDPLLPRRKQVQQRGRRALQQIYKSLSFKRNMGTYRPLGTLLRLRHILERHLLSRWAGRRIDHPRIF